MATGDALRYYDVTQKTSTEYPIPGEKFHILSHGKYICMLLKDHNCGSGTL